MRVINDAPVTFCPDGFSRSRRDAAIGLRNYVRSQRRPNTLASANLEHINTAIGRTSNDKCGKLNYINLPSKSKREVCNGTLHCTRLRSEVVENVEKVYVCLSSVIT